MNKVLLCMLFSVSIIGSVVGSEDILWTGAKQRSMPRIIVAIRNESAERIVVHRVDYYYGNTWYSFNEFAQGSIPIPAGAERRVTLVYRSPVTNKPSNQLVVTINDEEERLYSYPQRDRHTFCIQLVKGKLHILEC